MRRTQRAPRSCVECSSRKIKCDKVIPCRPCKKRGQAARCTREAVLIRGRVTVAEDTATPGTSRLSAGQEGPQRRPAEQWSTERHALELPIRLFDGAPSNLIGGYLVHDLEEFLCQSTAQSSFTSPVHDWHDVILPSSAQSHVLAQHASIWTSWIHCALNHVEFEREHVRFWEQMPQAANLKEHSPFWLAIYFASLAASLLTLDMAEVDIFFEDTSSTLLTNWYGAALFCLDKADYMRNYDLRTVQAIAILQMSCSAVGDFRFRPQLIVLGISIAKRLGLPFDAEKGDKSLLDCEISRRLWWTLVVCDWLTPRSHRPCISEEDFDMRLPHPVDDSRLLHGYTTPGVSFSDPICPLFYHTVISETATVYYRFQRALRKGILSVNTLVASANEELARIISDLPPHLQPDRHDCQEPGSLWIDAPWIEWQRIDLCSLLLSYRILINRTLEEAPCTAKELPNSLVGARAICVDAARAIVSISTDADLPTNQRKYWTSSLRTFNAGFTLALQIREGKCKDHQSFEYRSDVLQCISLLDRASVGNAIAGRAAEILRGMIVHLPAFLLVLEVYGYPSIPND